MVNINFMVLLAAAVVPLLVGFFWYNPKMMGNAWMVSSGMTEEKMKGSNMPLIFGVTFLFSFLIALSLSFNVIHQFGVQSLIGGDVVHAKASYPIYHPTQSLPNHIG